MITGGRIDAAGVTVGLTVGEAPRAADAGAIDALATGETAATGGFAVAAGFELRVTK